MVSINVFNRNTLPSQIILEATMTRRRHPWRRLGRSRLSFQKTKRCRLRGPCGPLRETLRSSRGLQGLWAGQWRAAMIGFHAYDA